MAGVAWQVPISSIGPSFASLSFTPTTPTTQPPLSGSVPCLATLPLQLLRRRASAAVPLAERLVQRDQHLGEAAAVYTADVNIA